MGPISTYINSHNGFTRANNVSDDVMMGSCPVNVFLDYLRLGDWGLPISKQPDLIRACQPVVAAAASSSEGLDGSNVDNELWPLLSEHAWIRACRIKRSQQQQEEDRSTGVSGAKTILDRRLHFSNTTAAARKNAVADGGTTDHDLPRCDVIDWHTARYTLAEYAEAVPRTSAGNPEPVADSKLPVLLLLLRLPTAAAATTVAKAGPESQAAEAVKGFGIDSGCDVVSEYLGHTNTLDQDANACHSCRNAVGAREHQKSADIAARNLTD